MAEPIAVTPNVTGGYTVLTNEDCRTNSKHLQAYATDEKGHATYACWYPEGEWIYFLPKSGKLRRLPIDQFDIVPPPVKMVKPNAKIHV